MITRQPHMGTQQLMTSQHYYHLSDGAVVRVLHVGNLSVSKHKW